MGVVFLFPSPPSHLLSNAQLVKKSEGFIDLG